MEDSLALFLLLILLLFGMGATLNRLDIIVEKVGTLETTITILQEGSR